MANLITKLSKDSLLTEETRKKLANFSHKRNLYAALEYRNNYDDSNLLKLYLDTFNFGPDTQIKNGLYLLLVKYQAKVCGGSVVNLILKCNIKKKEELKVNYTNDIDIFFPDEKSLLSFKEEFWNVCFIVRPMGTIETQKSFTIKISDSIGIPHVIVQLIRVKFANTIKEVVDSFDLNICKMGLDFSTGRIYISPEAELDVLGERISVNTTLGPRSFSTLCRIKKYADRFGYNSELAVRQYLTLLKENEFKTYKEFYAFQNLSDYERAKVHKVLYAKEGSDPFELNEFKKFIMEEYVKT